MATAEERKLDEAVAEVHDVRLGKGLVRNHDLRRDNLRAMRIAGVVCESLFHAFPVFRQPDCGLLVRMDRHCLHGLPEGDIAE